MCSWVVWILLDGLAKKRSSLSNMQGKSKIEIFNKMMIYHIINTLFDLNQDIGKPTLFDTFEYDDILARQFFKQFFYSSSRVTVVMFLKHKPIHCSWKLYHIPIYFLKSDYRWCCRSVVMSIKISIIIYKFTNLNLQLEVLDFW